MAGPQFCEVPHNYIQVGETFCVKIKVPSLGEQMWFSEIAITHKPFLAAASFPVSCLGSF